LPRSDGIDVSQWNGAIDWDAVGRAGCRWAATQVLDRNKENRLDPRFLENRSGMARAGIRYRGLYYFPVANRPVDVQAQEFLAAIGPLARGEFVMLDAETDADFGEWTEALSYEWLLAVEPTTRRPSAVYTGAFVDGGRIWESSRIYDGSRPRVFAAYTDEGSARIYAGGHDWDLWQFSGSGSYPGVTGACDLDQLDQTGRFERASGFTEEDADLAIYQLIQPQIDGDPGFAAAWFVIYGSGRVRWASNADTAWCARNGIAAEPVLMGRAQYDNLMNDATIGWPA